MPWGRLDDQANGNAKLLALSDSAFRMWACGLIYCQANLTNGFIAEHMIYAFGVRARHREALADELCTRLVKGKGPLWHRVKGGFRVHDYLDWNDSKTQVLAARKKGNERVKRFRKRKRNAVTNGPRSLVHDHVPRTILSKDQKGSLRGKVFAGQRLSVSQKQHEVIVNELGASAGHIDILLRYEAWDADLQRTGEVFDTLDYCRRRAGEAVKALRAGGALFSTADDMWCHHEPKCPNKLFHASVVHRETEAAAV
jgi:hypothetical protein